MRLALVHDWLVAAGGGEHVLSEALKVFPGAPVHALIDKMSDADHERLGIPRAHTSWMQSMPGIERNYRSWLAMMPSAMRSIDLGDATSVLAISHAVAKMPRVRPQQRLLCLSLSPMRYAWDLREQYLTESGLDRGVKGAMARSLLAYMQGVDRETSARVDAFASISRYIADRVKRAYGRDSEVIYPPVDTEFFTPAAAGPLATPGPFATTGPFAATGPFATTEPSAVAGASMASAADGYYVTASRFVPYKRVDLIARAFAADRSRRLVIVGDGPDADKVRAAAAGAPNVTFTGHANRDDLRGWLRGARAFVFAAEEDFGIAPIEAQACGTPVIAFGKGGALETIVPHGSAGASGLFFAEQTVESLLGAIETFESAGASITAAACRASAERFAASRFRSALRSWVEANGR